MSWRPIRGDRGVGLACAVFWLRPRSGSSSAAITWRWSTPRGQRDRGCCLDGAAPPVGALQPLRSPSTAAACVRRRGNRHPTARALPVVSPSASRPRRPFRPPPLTPHPRRRAASYNSPCSTPVVTDFPPPSLSSTASRREPSPSAPDLAPHPRTLHSSLLALVPPPPVPSLQQPCVQGRRWPP